MNSMNFQERVTQEARLVLLRCLTELPGYRANSSTLQNLLSSWAVQQTRDQVRTQLFWLKEQGLIEVEEELKEVLVVKITPRGAEVASGLATVPGVQRPSP